MKWTTKDGKEIDIKDMTTKHIQNCIDMLGKQFNACEGEVIEGHYDAEGIDCDIYHYENAEEMFPIIHWFRKELLKRLTDSKEVK